MSTRQDKPFSLGLLRGGQATDGGTGASRPVPSFRAPHFLAAVLSSRPARLMAVPAPRDGAGQPLPVFRKPRFLSELFPEGQDRLVEAAGENYEKPAASPAPVVRAPKFMSKRPVPRP